MPTPSFKLDKALAGFSVELISPTTIGRLELPTGHAPLARSLFCRHKIFIFQRVTRRDRNSATIRRNQQVAFSDSVGHARRSLDIWIVFYINPVFVKKNCWNPTRFLKCIVLFHPIRFATVHKWDRLEKVARNCP